MKRNRFSPQQKEESNNWLLTYSDTVTLLLAFFVLMLAVSTIDQSKFEYVVEALTNGTAGNYHRLLMRWKTRCYILSKRIIARTSPSRAHG